MAKVKKESITRKAFELVNYGKEQIQDFFNDREIQDNIINVPSNLNDLITKDEKNGWNAFLMVCTNIKTLTKIGPTIQSASYITDAVKASDTTTLYQTGVSKGYVKYTDTAAGYGVAKKKK